MEHYTSLKIGGTYKHYKGKLYKVIAIGHGTEDLKQYVVYQSLYNDKNFGDQAIWIRPLDMFTEQIELDGGPKLRFELVQD